MNDKSEKHVMIRRDENKREEFEKDGKRSDGKEQNRRDIELVLMFTQKQQEISQLFEVYLIFCLNFDKKQFSKCFSI